MSFFRLYTNATTYTDYENIWNVSVDPIAVDGAIYWQHELRSCQFTMPTNATIDRYRADVRKPKIYRLKGEVWETFEYYDADGNLQTRNKLLFWGYMFQDSFAFETVAEHAGKATNLVTITLRDYLSVLELFLSERWEIEAGLIGKPTTVIPYDTDINIIDEIMKIWGYVPASSTDLSYPLWSRPPLSNQMSGYPGYGHVYEGWTIWAGTQAPGGSAAHYGCIYQDADTGNIYFEALAIGIGAWPYTSCFVWEKYRVIGSSLALEPDYPVIIEASAALLPRDPDTAANLITNGAYPAYPWTQKSLTVTIDGIPRTYDVGGYYYPVTLKLTATLPPDTIRTMPSDVVGTEPSAAMSWYDINIPDWLKPGVVARPISSPNQDEEQGWEVNTKDWLSFLLLLKFGWLKENDNSYAIVNRLFMPAEAASATPQAQAKLLNYSESYTTSIQSYGAGATFIHDAEIFNRGINEFASKTYNTYNKVCSFSTNQEYSVGDYILLSTYNSNPIQIIGVEYNPHEPFKWTYTGRSY